MSCNGTQRALGAELRKLTLTVRLLPGSNTHLFLSASQSSAASPSLPCPVGTYQPDPAAATVRSAAVELTAARAGGKANTLPCTRCPAGRSTILTQASLASQCIRELQGWSMQRCRINAAPACCSCLHSRCRVADIWLPVAVSCGLSNASDSAVLRRFPARAACMRLEWCIQDSPASCLNLRHQQHTRPTSRMSRKQVWHQHLLLCKLKQLLRHLSCCLLCSGLPAWLRHAAARLQPLPARTCRPLVSCATTPACAAANCDCLHAVQNIRSLQGQVLSSHSGA